MWTKHEQKRKWESVVWLAVVVFVVVVVVLCFFSFTEKIVGETMILTANHNENQRAKTHNQSQFGENGKKMTRNIPAITKRNTRCFVSVFFFSVMGIWMLLPLLLVFFFALEFIVCDSRIVHWHMYTSYIAPVSWMKNETKMRDTHSLWRSVNSVAHNVM